MAMASSQQPDLVISDIEDANDLDNESQLNDIEAGKDKSSESMVTVSGIDGKDDTLSVDATSTDIVAKEEDAIVDIEAGIEVPVGVAMNQIGVISPPRTPGGRLLLAPPTPKLNMSSDGRPVTATKEPTRLEKLRTVAFAQIAKHKPKDIDAKLRDMYKNFHSSTFGVWLTKIDFWLEKHLAHHLRYYYFLIFFQLFPILFFMFRVRPTMRRKCDEPLETYIIGSGVIAIGRILVGLFVMQRISNRDWPGQTFGEALGQVWNMVEKQGNVDDSFVNGYRLNMLIVFIVAVDVGFWMFGFITILVSQSAICADRITEDAVAMLCYQFFNVFIFTAQLDVVLPYFHLEFDPDVDVYVAGVKNSSGDEKRKMKQNMAKRKREAEREKERARKRMGIKVIQVAPADASGSPAKGGDKKGGKKKGGKSKSEGDRPETAWWENEKGVPPRKKKAIGGGSVASSGSMSSNTSLKSSSYSSGSSMSSEGSGSEKKKKGKKKKGKAAKL